MGGMISTTNVTFAFLQMHNFKKGVVMQMGTFMDRKGGKR